MLISHGLVNGKTDDFVSFLFSEQIQDLEVLFIISCSCFVSVQTHLWNQFLISFYNLGNKEGSVKGKVAVANKPNHSDQCKHHFFTRRVIRKTISHILVQNWCYLSTLSRLVSLEHQPHHWALNLFHLMVSIINSHLHNLEYLTEAKEGNNDKHDEWNGFSKNFS